MGFNAVGVNGLNGIPWLFVDVKWKARQCTCARKLYFHLLIFAKGVEEISVVQWKKNLGWLVNSTSGSARVIYLYRRTIRLCSEAQNPDTPESLLSWRQRYWLLSLSLVLSLSLSFCFCSSSCSYSFDVLLAKLSS